MKNEKVLLISICKEKLHELEFVRPIEDILKGNNREYFIKHYKKIRKGDLANSSHAIICGTSLQDNEYVKDISHFLWIQDYNKPVLGICAGMQIISLVFEGTLNSGAEIGFYKENFKKEFLSLNGEQEVYHLHNSHSKVPKEFEKYTDSKIPQAIKHRAKDIYGVLFHPEVRQKELIKNFLE